MNTQDVETRLRAAEAEHIAAEAELAAITERIETLRRELMMQYNDTAEAVAMQKRLHAALEAGDVAQVVTLCHDLCDGQEDYVERGMRAGIDAREYDRICTRVWKARYAYLAALDAMERSGTS